MYQVHEHRSGNKGFTLRGGNLQLWKCRDHECIDGGPAETGKTFAACQKLDSLLWKYPRSQAVMVRKVRDTIHSTCLQTYRKIIGNDSPIMPFGGQVPSWFDYPNGSRLWLAGMDNPGKALSAERDYIYVNQSEELFLADWETLLTRATGRAGNAPYPQVFGDCNPESEHHWIKKRSVDGGPLKLFESRHEDNPMLWDAEKREWTEQGRRTIAILDSLTGVRRERLRHGRWVSAEGTVYQFDARHHLIDPFLIPSSWTRLRSFDFGYTNPFVCLWIALDPDGRMIVYRELYMTQRTVRVHALQVKDRSQGESFAANVADHDAEGRATLNEAGIWTEAAEKEIRVGIDAVTERLKIAGDGRPRLLIMRGALVERDETLATARKPVCLEQEFDLYQWPKAADGRPIKEVPLDVNNHSLDALRYACRWADRMGRGDPGDIGVGTDGGSIIDRLGDIWR